MPSEPRSIKTWDAIEMAFSQQNAPLSDDEHRFEVEQLDQVASEGLKVEPQTGQSTGTCPKTT